MFQKSRHSFFNPKVSCVAGIVQFFKHKLAKATIPWNHKLIYLRFQCTIHNLQAMNFMKAEMAIITSGVYTYFPHSSIGQILLSLVYYSKSARFKSQRVHPGLMAILS